jgi:hypothetical protein
MFQKNSALHDHLLKQERLVFEVTIKANATPASKQHIVDIPGSVYLRTQGKTSEADAVEDLSSQVPTAADATGVFALMIDQQTSKFLKATVTPSVGSVSVSKEISTGGRMVLEIDSDQNLSTTDLTLLVELEAKLK